ncbi:MAG: hypothetical protein IJU63_02385 [Bacteroidales bacterium]|nr:hypothetical protein [Bacteroidales bacterium]
MKSQFCFAVIALFFLLSCSADPEMYLAFPLNETPKPKETQSIVPEQVSGTGGRFYAARRFDSGFVSLTPATLREDGTRTFLSVCSEDGDLEHHFVIMGRGPAEMLSSSQFLDVYNGYAHLYDLMTSYYYEIDLTRSVELGGTVVSKSIKIDSNQGENGLIFPSHYDRGDKLLAYDMGVTKAGGIDYVYPPRYDEYDLKTGKMVKSYTLFQSAGTGSKKELPEQPAFSLKDCMDDSRQRLCFTMSKQPVLGFIDLRSGNVFGVKVSGLYIRGKKELNRYYFGPVASKGENIYAIYYGSLETQTQRIPDLYVFNWQGVLKRIYNLDAHYNQLWSEDDGLYLTKMAEDKSGLLIYRIPWNLLEELE